MIDWETEPQVIKCKVRAVSRGDTLRTACVSALWGGKLRAVCPAVPQTPPQRPLHMETADLRGWGV